MSALSAAIENTVLFLLLKILWCGTERVFDTVVVVILKREEARKDKGC